MIEFWKMHGCGNDFVVLDEATLGKRSQKEWGKLASRLLDRRFGIGADQLVVIGPSKESDFSVRFFENDSNESEMCGNGIRAAARYLLEKKTTTLKEISFETISGPKRVWVEDFSRIRVDMGPPIFESEKIPLATSERIWGKEVDFSGQKLKIHTLSMGNPHAVTFIDKRENLDWTKTVGPAVEHHELFPKRTNAEFVFVEDRKNLIVRVWERGAGETYACGTGACAAAVASIHEKKADSPVTIHFKGGNLEIAWEMGNSVFMTGPAEKVFIGRIEE